MALVLVSANAALVPRQARKRGTDRKVQTISANP